MGRGGEKQKLAPGELWKAQQLKEYRRAQGLCFKCGDKYTPGHVCSKQETPQLKAMELQEEAIVLTDELLDAVTGLELSEDSANLSLHALAGTSHTNIVQLRALSSNQVLIVLVDSGSSHSFINSALCHRLHLLSEPIPPTSVRVANGEVLVCDAKISQFDWWVQGHQFSFPVRVLPMGGYDLVLGMDWLTQYSPMTCDWAAKWLQFSYQGSLIKLQGIQSSSDLTTPQEATPEQVVKWTKGNDVWAIAVLEQSGGVTIPVSEFPEIQSLLSEFESVFQNVSDLPPHRALDHAIPLLPNAIPVNSRPYSYSPAQKDEIERQVSEMLSARLITTSCSPFASPVLLVKKKDNSWRFCVDYRRLNALTVKNKFPLPIVDELLDELAGTKYFSKLDLRSGYHQIRMLEFDEYKTAFKTHHGHFQFRVMPFGLTNAPATFQCLMNSIFAPFLRKFVLLFMDDILIYNKCWEDHLQHLKCVLQLLQQHQFCAKLSKCTFVASQLEYLGHIISAQGVATDPDKTQVMRQWPIPTNLTELRGFLGLTGYYRKFVQNYGILAKPLTMLLQKNAKFVWTDQAHQAFLALKQDMVTAPVLISPDFSKSFTIETDACSTGIGAVLSQEGHPVAFYSKALGVNNQKLSIYEKEFLAIMMAIDKWRAYLLRGPFVIKTNHQSLCHLDDQVLGFELQRKAMTKLIGL